VEQAVVDEAHKVVTAPAYMDGDASIGQVAAGIRKMIQQVVEWA
jgi:enhancing lycopene biosynthesis protein 2